MSESSKFAELTTTDGVLRVRIAGPILSYGEMRDIATHVDKELTGAAVPRFVVLDFSAVTFTDSGGLGGCVSVNNRAHEVDARTVVMGLTPTIEAMLTTTRLHKVFTIVKDEDELARLVREA